eukprot:Sspe_Gene.44145::Locus_21637_Transcript_2_2_Confidence_0.750_Length_1255::g.44145::m.44145
MSDGQANKYGFPPDEYKKRGDELMDAVRDALPTSRPDIYNRVWVERFLRARKLNVEKAKAMLLESIKWREENNVDTILDGPAPDPRVLQRFPHGVSGKSRFGHPLYFERTGMSMLTSEEVVPMAALLHWKIYLSEFLDRELRKPDAQQETVVAVLDMTGLTLSKANKHAMDFCKMVGDIEEKNYPESLCKIFVVNAGWVFASVWKVAKYFFSSEVREKIVICGSGYMAQLEEYIDRSEIPTYLGGPKVIEEEWAGDLAYMDALPSSAVHEGLDAKVELKAGEIHAHTVEVDQGHTLMWTFCTEQHSVAFSVTGPDRAVLVGEEKHDCANKLVSGRLSADSAGSYTLHFSNKFSWRTSKVVRFKAETFSESFAD